MLNMNKQLTKIIDDIIINNHTEIDRLVTVAWLLYKYSREGSLSKHDKSIYTNQIEYLYLTERLAVYRLLENYGVVHFQNGKNSNEIERGENYLRAADYFWQNFVVVEWNKT